MTGVVTCSDLNLEPWTEPAGSICVCVVVVSALRGPDIMHCVLSLYCHSGWCLCQ